MVAENLFFFFRSSSTDYPFFLSSPDNFFLFSTFDGSCSKCMSVIFLFVFGYGLCSDYMLNLGMGCIS